MLTFIVVFFVTTWIGSFFFGIITGFWKIAESNPRFKTQPNDYTQSSVIFALVYWPAMVAETYTIKIFG